MRTQIVSAMYLGMFFLVLTSLPQTSMSDAIHGNSKLGRFLRLSDEEKTFFAVAKQELERLKFPASRFRDVQITRSETEVTFLFETDLSKAREDWRGKLRPTPSVRFYFRKGSSSLPEVRTCDLICEDF